MKRILIFSTAYYPDFIGGAEIAVKEITDRINQDDIVFDMVTLRLDPQMLPKETIGNINIYRVGLAFKLNNKKWLSFQNSFNKYTMPVIGLFRSLLLSFKYKYNATWSIMASYNSFLALFFKIIKPRIPFILTLQEGDPFDYVKKRVGIFHILFRKIFQRADFVQVISSYLADWAKRMGVKRDISVIPNGVDLRLFNNSAKKIYKSDLGFSNSDIVLVTTSRLVKKNAVQDIIYSLKFLPDNYKLLIIGKGIEYQKLVNLVHKEELVNRVKFVGFINYSDLPDYLNVASVFVRPSLSEGFGNSFIEAMAVNLPVIGTNVGGIKDFLEDQKTGFVVPVNSPEGIAKKVLYIKDNPKEVQKITLEASNMVRARYDWSKISQSMQDLFEKAFSLNDRKYILIATGVYPPQLGGPAEYAKNIRDIWAKDGHTVFVKNFDIEHNMPPFIRHIWYLLRIIPNMFVSDFVLALDTFSVALPVVIVSKIIRKPVIIRTGGDFLWESYLERTKKPIIFTKFYDTQRGDFSFKERIIFFLTGFVLKNSKHIIFSTTWQRDVWMKIYRFSMENTSIVENCYTRPNLDGDFERKVSADKVFIGSARKIFWKNLETIKDVFFDIKMVSPDVSLDINNYRHEEFLKRIKDSYAVILVSLGDISPNMIMETIGLGKPFILTKENGINNRVGDYALLIDPLNKDDIKEKINWLLDPVNYNKQLKKISEFNFEHNYKEIAQEILNVYLNLNLMNKI